MTVTKTTIDTTELYKTYLMRYGNNYDALVALSRDGLGPLFFKQCDCKSSELIDEFGIDNETLKKANWIPWDGEENN